MTVRVLQRVPWMPMVFAALLSAVAAAYAGDSFQAFEGSALPAVDRQAVQRSGSPLQNRDPVKFWTDRTVCQKRGIVIEDKDYVVRKRYWILEGQHLGRVQKVVVGDRGAKCTVLFDDATGWREQALAERPESQTVTSSTMTVSRTGGTEVDTMSTTYHVEGVAVGPADVGVIVGETSEGTVVEFPAQLLRLEMPQMHDKVVRGPDWAGSYADGGEMPFGESAHEAEGPTGSVVGLRDADGNYDVEWEVTGRITVVRFDAAGGFYDIVKVPGDHEPADPSSDQEAPKPEAERE